MDLAPDSDARLVARCRSGDEQAWAELVERFSRYVYAIAVQAFRLSEPDAEDVFQDVFARIYERLYSLRDDEAVRPWIAQLTRRACIDRLRAGSRTQASLEDTELAAAEDEIGRLDEALTVRDALARLPEQCREVLDRFFTRDESYQTIGAALDLPSGTIASRISRCLGRLREQLAGRKLESSPSGGR
jgi:RNA polymerase sigma-70 factor (ECF subfamily)